MYDQELLDALTVLSTLIGIANYQENLTQSDKDDIMKRLDQQTTDILTRIEQALEKQNDMLRELLRRNDDIKN